MISYRIYYINVCVLLSNHEPTPMGISEGKDSVVSFSSSPLAGRQSGHRLSPKRLSSHHGDDPQKRRTSSDYNQCQFYLHIDLGLVTLTSQREQSLLTVAKRRGMNETVCRTYPSSESLPGSLKLSTASWGWDARSDGVGHSGTLRSGTCGEDNLS